MASWRSSPKGLYDGDGNDTVYGEGGNDHIEGDAGKDIMNGSGGNDRINSAGDGSYDEIYCGSGWDLELPPIGHGRREGLPPQR